MAYRDDERLRRLRLAHMSERPQPETPRLHQNSQTISLSFETTLIQSCMRLDDPHDLVLDYTRAMMGFLLLKPTPASILMIGLGGGSMLKYLRRHLPLADITAVELNQGVIDLRQDFHIPPDDDRLRIVCADGATFLARPPRVYDVILVDGFTGQGMPEGLCSKAFYQHGQKALAPEGLIVANVQADTEHTRQITRRLAKIFGGQVALVESEEGGNVIATAGAQITLERGAAEFEARWAALPAAHQETLAASSTRLHRALLKVRRTQAIDPD